MGKLRITKKGIRLEGEEEFVKNMKVSKIESYKVGVYHIICLMYTQM
jgi:hypothetical protein